ncbi:MAG: tRNA threonylcarbamoyladenosine biosynthesis protein TsaE [Abditibacteriota bacterium]|nr:tRNA threonylcarbamoyladenosine biosynthesis protein TsaE [Abditibacteriota bacterium]
MFCCHTHNSTETHEFGRRIGARLKAGDLLLLRGELGAGKTTFTKGVAQALGITSEVTSPTFVLLLEHEGTLPMLHLDAYRLEDLDAPELQDAGLFDFLAREDAVKLIEWPERIAAYLPAARFDIAIHHCEDETRRRIEWTESEASL